MVMNYELIDTYLHMSNHYKLLNSAKSVVNTSPPKSYLLRNKHNSSSVASPSSRSTTTTLLSKIGVTSRTNSHCDLRRRNIKIHDCLQNDLPPSRSSTVPPKPSARRLPKPWNQSFLKTSKPCSRNNSGDSKSKSSSRETTNLSRESSKYDSNVDIKQDGFDGRPNSTKKPIPTPRKALPINKSVIPNYEYLQFSLRITEDIIRNDLYNPIEMQRVFNSHLEANRGRLDMTKMLQQIDHLCKELSITTNVNSDSEKKTATTDLTLCNDSKLLLDQIPSRQYQITNEEIRNFNSVDLQNIITGILDDSIVCLKETSISDDFVDLPKNTIDAEILINVCSNEQILITPQRTSLEESTKNFDVQTEGIRSKETIISDKSNNHDLENVCTELIPIISNISEINDSKNFKELKENSIENKSSSSSSLLDEVEPTNNISVNNNKETTVINLEVNQLHNDLLEINKSLNEGFFNLKETIITENPVKEISTMQNINEFKNEKSQINIFPINIDNTNHDNISILTAEKENIEKMSKNTDYEVSIKKNEITQTPFSKEICQFFEKLPDALSNTEDSAKSILVENNDKDLLNFVGITENIEIEYKQSSESTDNDHAIQNNFITTVNNMILNKINDLFEPVPCKDIVANNTLFTNDYYKYEIKTTAENKYSCDKYKLQRFTSVRNFNEENLYKHMTIQPEKSSEISLSEGELIVNATKTQLKNIQPMEKTDENILKVLEKYERKTCNDNTSINKYKLNKYEQNYGIPMHRFYSHRSASSPLSSSKISRISVRQESLLSDGEIKYSSDSDECKTDYSFNSSKLLSI